MSSTTLDEATSYVPDRILAVVKASQTADPDRVIRIMRTATYPNRAWYCIASFIGFVSMCHFASLLYRIRRRQSTLNTVTRGVVSYRRLPAAAMNAFRAFAFRWTIPVGKSYTLNLSEVFLTAAYIVIVFVWSLVNSTSTMGLKYDPKYWANRAGHIASVQLPLMTALGTKNNILSLLTGVSFDKLNYLHRMVARVLCVLTWVHGAGRMELGMTGKVGWHNPWIQSGMLGSTALAVLSIISIRPLRERNYEVFLVIHFVLSFIFLLTAYFHAAGLELGYLIWPSFLIWGLDRLIRVVRIVLFNLGYFKSGAKSTEADAQVEILSPHFLRITLQRPLHMHWIPGQSAYLSIPSVSGFRFEAHPFTISTIDVPHQALAIVENEKTDLEATSSESQDEGVAFKKLAFLVRVRSGFTKRLLKAAEKRPAMKVILDGPYSSPPMLRGFETVVLIAGGSGIAFTLPLLLDAVQRAKGEQGSECHRIVFIWAIRDASHIEWISDALLPAIQDIPSSITVDIRVYVTAVVEDSRSWDDDSAEGDAELKGDAKSGPQLPGVNVEQGRPELKMLIDEEINRATGHISVNVCGTHALASAVRSALRPPRFMDVLKGGPTVTLHVEAFGNV